MPRVCPARSRPSRAPPPVRCGPGVSTPRRTALASVAAAVCSLPSASPQPPPWASFLGVKPAPAADPDCGRPPVEALSTPRKPRTAADAGRAGARPRAEANVAAAERAALDADRERATREFVDSMWQGLE